MTRKKRCREIKRKTVKCGGLFSLFTEAIKVCYKLGKDKRYIRMGALVVRGPSVRTLGSMKP